MGGVISFKKALLPGLWITLIGSVMYSLGWEIAYHNFLPDFMEKYADAAINMMREEGKPESEIVKEQKNMKDWVELYKIFPIRFGMTLLEVIPVGLLVTLFSALVLKKKPK